jgi:hypothetical protein
MLLVVLPVSLVDVSRRVAVFAVALHLALDPIALLISAVGPRVFAWALEL